MSCSDLLLVLMLVPGMPVSLHAVVSCFHAKVGSMLIPSVCTHVAGLL